MRSPFCSNTLERNRRSSREPRLVGRRDRLLSHVSHLFETTTLVATVFQKGKESDRLRSTRRFPPPLLDRTRNFDVLGRVTITSISTRKDSNSHRRTNDHGIGIGRCGGCDRWRRREERDQWRRKEEVNDRLRPRDAPECFDPRRTYFRSRLFHGVPPPRYPLSTREKRSLRRLEYPSTSFRRFPTFRQNHPPLERFGRVFWIEERFTRVFQITRFGTTETNEPVGFRDRCEFGR